MGKPYSKRVLCSVVALLMMSAACAAPDGTTAGSAAGIRPAAGSDAVLTTTYAGTHWMVNDARISDGPPDDSNDDVTYVHVTVEVENTLEDRTLRFPTGLFVLRSDAGEVSRSAGLLTSELKSSISMEPGEIITGDLVFPFETRVDPDVLTFSIEESGREPAIISLSGEAVAPPHPIEVAISRDRRTVSSSSVGRHDVDVEPLGVDVSLDWGSRRADAGTYFLIAQMRAMGLTSSGGGTNIFKSMFRLQVDGVPRGPKEADGPGLIGNGVAADYAVVFEVPQEAEQLELIVGETEEKQTTYPIEF